MKIMLSCHLQPVNFQLFLIFKTMEQSAMQCQLFGLKLKMPQIQEVDKSLVFIFTIIKIQGYIPSERLFRAPLLVDASELKGASFQVEQPIISPCVHFFIRIHH